MCLKLSDSVDAYTASTHFEQNRWEILSGVEFYWAIFAINSSPLEIKQKNHFLINT